MTFKGFIKEKLYFLVVNSVLFLVVGIFLYYIEVPLYLIILLFSVWSIPLVLSYWLDFNKRASFYNQLQDGFESIDKKYILPEIIEEPSFMEGKIVYDILAGTSKQMHEHVKKYINAQFEYREYIEAWVHEIKTPIASSKLLIQNGKDLRSVVDELDRVENYIEQVLYYARSTEASKDYIVREFPLKSVITKVLQKNSKGFIYKKIKLRLGEIDEVVYSDAKWTEFILNQILVNAINYSMKEQSEIKIYTTTQEHNLVLTVEDNGIGIEERDIGRVFDKGFTGENGRKYTKSTGMGLYICKKLSKKLHIGLTIESKKDIGTKVHITFPKSKVLLLES